MQSDDKAEQAMALISENEVIHVPISHAAIPICQSVRVHVSSSLGNLLSVGIIFACYCLPKEIC